MVVAGAWAEKTQAIGINGLRNSVGFEGGTEVREVLPGGVGAHEATGYIKTGMVIDGEQQDLFCRCGPPLVDGAVVLPEVADPGATETPVGAWLADGSWEKMRELGFDVGFDAGAGAFEAAEAV